MTESDSQRVLLEVTVAAPVDTVWRALRDPAEIRRWFGRDYDGLEDEIRFIFGEGAKYVDDERSVRWDYGDQKVERFQLEPLGSTTRLRVIRSRPPGEDWVEIYDDISEGWTTFVHQLRCALGRHPGEDRRTPYLSAHREAADAAKPVEALGLDAVGAAEGSPYRLTAADGEDLAGEVWYRSAHQLGLTVDAHGDGLVVVTTDAASSKPPHGGGSSTVTTCGLDDDEFDRVSRAWTGWWQENYPERVDDASATTP